MTFNRNGVWSRSFRVESTDVTQGDVRIKETDTAYDKARPSTSHKCDSPSAAKSGAEKARKEGTRKSGGSPHTSQKRRNFSRSQSVTAPKPAAQKSAEPSFSYKCTKQGSLSTMSAADLENWKLSVLDPAAAMPSSRSPTTTATTRQEEPLLTVAGSLADSTNVTVGFDVEEEKKE